MYEDKTLKLPKRRPPEILHGGSMHATLAPEREVPIGQAILEREARKNPCFCMGPQGDDPVCPCKMREQGLESTMPEHADVLQVRRKGGGDEQ